MSPAGVLIVDDEPNIRLILSRSLKGEGYEITQAADGEEAIRLIGETTYDVILLDLQMRSISGIHVLRAARERDPEVAVIILTAHGTLNTAIEALQLGASDYLLKPVVPAQIRERVQESLKIRRSAMKRRNLIHQIDALRTLLDQTDEPEGGLLPPPIERRFLKSGPVILDRYRRTCTLDGATIDLTTTEYGILVALIQTKPEPLSPRAILNQVMGYDENNSDASRIVKWHIHQLRSKLEADPANPELILTVRYRGYIWAAG